MSVRKSIFPRGNAYTFTLIFLMVGIIALVHVFGSEMIMYHSASVPGITVGMTVPLMMAILLGLLHLMHSLPENVQNNYSYSSARGNLVRVGVLIATFTTVGAIAFQGEAFVLSQPTPSDSDLYLTRGFTMQANSSVVPTIQTSTWAVQNGEIDDIEVHVEGIASAPCGTNATIDFSVKITFNGGPIWIYPERQSTTHQDPCDDGAPSTARLGLTWSGFPIAEMGSVSITMTLFPHAENTNALLNVTIDKVTDANLLYWSKREVNWIFGSTVVLCWGYAGFATIILMIGLNRLRQWRKNDVRLYKESKRIWSRDDLQP
jgi:hypothetical protein